MGNGTLRRKGERMEGKKEDDLDDVGVGEGGRKEQQRASAR